MTEAKDIESLPLVGQATVSQRPGWVRTIRQSVPAVVGIAFVIVLWQLIVMITQSKPDVLPAPTRVFYMMWKYRAALIDNSIPTMQETIVGLVATVIAAAAFAVVADFFPLVRRFIYPILVVSQTIPMIVIAPLVVIWFGYGFTPKIFVIILVIFFSITVALTDGFDSTDRDAMNLLKSMRASRLQQFMLVRLPTALPSFFTGLRIAITWSVSAAIFSEYVGAEKGLGIFMQTSKNDFRTDLVLASVMVVSILSLILFGVVMLIRRLVIPWHIAVHERTR